MTISVAPPLEVPASRDHRAGGPGACSFPADDAHAAVPVYGGADTKDLPCGDWPGCPIWDETLPCSSGPDRNHHKSDNRCNGGGCTMRFCPTCRKPRTEGSKTCSSCGNPYPGGLANLEDLVGYGRGRVQAKARSLRTLRPAAFAAIAIVVLVVLIGGTGAVWLYGRHKQSPVAGTS